MDKTSKQPSTPHGRLAYTNAISPRLGGAGSGSVHIEPHRAPAELAPHVEVLVARQECGRMWALVARHSACLAAPRRLISRAAPPSSSRSCPIRIARCVARRAAQPAEDAARRPRSNLRVAVHAPAIRTLQQKDPMEAVRLAAMQALGLDSGKAVNSHIQPSSAVTINPFRFSHLL